MSATRPLLILFTVLFDAAAAQAQVQPATAPVPPAAPAPTAAPTAATPASDWEGALGLIVGNGPEYSGSDRRATKATPGFFVRWGRLTITNAGGFVTRRNDEVLRGLGVDMLRTEQVRVSLGLRFDAGRRESSSSDLRGLGDVRSTVRARVSATWRPARDWRASVGWSLDAFGRGGGNFGEAGLAHDWHASEQTVVTLGSSIAYGGDRYLQTYYGVSAEQSARSGLPRYEPSAGLRDASLYVNQRTQLGRHWVLLGGVSVNRLLGPAADSPLVRRPTGLAASAAVAYSF